MNVISADFYSYVLALAKNSYKKRTRKRVMKSSAVASNTRVASGPNVACLMPLCGPRILREILPKTSNHFYSNTNLLYRDKNSIFIVECSCAVLKHFGTPIAAFKSICGPQTHFSSKCGLLLYIDLSLRPMLYTIRHQKEHLNSTVAK
jgi:hypothetical protein